MRLRLSTAMRRYKEVVAVKHSRLGTMKAARRHGYGSQPWSRVKGPLWIRGAPPMPPTAERKIPGHRWCNRRSGGACQLREDRYRPRAPEAFRVLTGIRSS